MKKSILLGGILFLLAACTKNMDELEQPGGTEPSSVTVVYDAKDAVAGELIVKFREEVADSLAQALVATETRSEQVSADALLQAVGVENIYPLFGSDPRYEERHRAFGLHQWYVVTFDEKLPVRTMVEQLSADHRIEVLQYVRRPQLRGRFVVHPLLGGEVEQTRASTPTNDPLLSKQWHYNNDGQVVRVSKKGSDINLYDAWEKTYGDESIVVAVIDEAVQYTHPDLAQNIWQNPSPTKGDQHGYNFINNTATLDWSYVDKETYEGQTYYYNADHGTHVAGTIAAVNNNGKGVCGIAGGNGSKGGVKIMSCQIFGDSSKKSYDTSDSFRYAADNGALICQCSWGYTYDEGTSKEAETYRKAFMSSSEKTAIDYFIANAGKNTDSPIEGGLVIFAAGNDGDLFGNFDEYPAAYDKVVSVAAMGSDFLPAYYTCYGSTVDITAPGGDAYNSSSNTDNGEVLSTILSDSSVTYYDGRDLNSPYGYMQGTSMACPHVSGVAALGLSYMKELGLKLTVDEFKEILLKSVQPINTYLTGNKYIYSGLTLQLSNYKNKMGSGYIDANLLLENLKIAYGLRTPPEITAQIANRLFKSDTPTSSIDLTGYFTDAAVSAYSAVANDESVVRVSVSDKVLKILPKKVGQTKITVSAKGYDGTIVSQSFTVTVRAQTNSTGGWL
jgi:subtilisin family serine protease